MFVIYYEEELEDGRISNYIIRETKEECNRVLELSGADCSPLPYVAGGNCEDYEEALAFACAEWFHLSNEEKARTALSDEKFRRRFVRKGL